MTLGRTTLETVTPLVLDGFHDRAARMVEARLAASADVASGIMLRARLADLQRAAGRIDAARATLDRLLEQDPDHGPATRLRRVLDGEGYGAVAEGPSPFLLRDDILPAGLADGLLRDALARIPSMTPAGIAHGNAGPEENQTYRRGLVTAFPRALRAAVLDHIAPLLAATPWAPGRMPAPDGPGDIKYAVSRPGDFFRPHRDDGVGDGRGQPGRRISFVLYLRDPQMQAAGGDLVLFDEPAPGRTGGQGATSPVSSTPVSSTLAFTTLAFTTLAYRHNRFAAFPSARLHEVIDLAAGPGAAQPVRVAVVGHV